jgi:hypothetical protein
MSVLENIYEFTTGEKPLYRKGASDYHTLKYVRWLEARVEDAPEPIKSVDEYHRKMKGINWFPDDDNFRAGYGLYPPPEEEG